MCVNAGWELLYSRNLPISLTYNSQIEFQTTPTTLFHSPTVPPTILNLEEPERRHDTCIEFTVRGYPHPTLRWFHRDKEIPQSAYVRIDMEIYQDYLEGCLTFKNPTHHNNGNYTLEASNFLGVTTKTVYGHFLNAPFDGSTLILTLTPTFCS